MDKILKMIAQRLGLGLITLFIVSLIIFSSVELLPGDLAEAILGQAATPETVAAFRKELKLDLPAHERYFTWLAGIVQGDMGKSLANQREISELIGVRLANTLFLALFAAVVSVPLAVVLGVLAALYRNSLYDRAVNVFTLSTISTPEFFVAYILILLLAVKAGAFPSLSNVTFDMPFWERVYRCSLPAMTLNPGRGGTYDAHDPGGDHQPSGQSLYRDGQSQGPIQISNHRASRVTQCVGADHQRDRLEPGLSDRWRGAGRGGFRLPRLGQLLVDSVSKRDIPVVQASTMIFAGTYILLNLTADVLSILSNPRLLHPK